MINGSSRYVTIGYNSNIYKT